MLRHSIASRLRLLRRDLDMQLIEVYNVGVNGEITMQNALLRTSDCGSIIIVKLSYLATMESYTHVLYTIA